MKKIKKSKEEIQSMQPLVLAYIGDAVYEVFIRNYILFKYGGTVNDLHKIATKFVKAKSQAKVVHAIQFELKDEEWKMIKRGRNQKSATVPKNADITDYRYATGFETLIGYLYLLEENERLEQIVKMSIEIIEGSF